jgi:hypothetical protein
MKLFNMDAHVAVIEDFKTLGLDVEVTDWSLSGHVWVLNKKQTVPKHINAMTFLNLNPKMIEDFQKEYDSFLSTFDGFIVGHPNSFAMIFEKYNKPIILINTCRYDIPFSYGSVRNQSYISAYHMCLYRLLNKGLLYTVSNNKVDQLYMGNGCGFRSEYLIPSLCLYTNMKYTPTKNTFLIYTGAFDHPLVTRRPELFEWSDLVTYRGIIHFPYEAGLTMSMFEHFTAGIPMFLPSKYYWKTHPTLNNTKFYWGEKAPPNLAAFKDDQFWIENSCMWETFASPNTIIFDSLEDLANKLETFEYVPDNGFRERRIERVKTQWKQVIDRIKAEHTTSAVLPTQDTSHS